MRRKNIVFELSEGVGLITLNRPDQYNTFNAEMLDELGNLYGLCDADDEVKVVVITGAGSSFCAGADLNGGADTFDGSKSGDFSSCPFSMQPWEIRKPVIAACNGHAVGIGLSIALQCDMRVFSETGKYGMLQNRRGVVADNAVEYVLPRLVGLERAFEILVRANLMTGVEAGEWGLAKRVVPVGEVLSVAMEIAQDMVRNCSPLVMAMHKRLLWRSLDSSLVPFIDLETKALHHSMAQSDAVEGGAAWLEKRAPEWRVNISNSWPDFL